MPLYPFQAEQLDQCREAFRTCQSVIMQLPTGGGKTVIAGHLATLLNKRNKNVLVLVHRQELIDQFAHTLHDVGLGHDLSFIAAGKPSQGWCRFQIGSIMTCIRREIRFQPDFIIIDEAHHCRAASWSKLLNRWKGVKTLGLTATPARLDGKGLGLHFDKIVVGKSMRWLIDNKYLAPFDYKVPASHLDMSGVRSQMGDYNKKEAYERVDEKVIADAASAYVKYANGKSALFFGIVRDHSKRVAAALNNMGISAEHVDGDTPKLVRRYAIERFKRKDLKVLCNVDIATEGVDIPGCEVVMLGRPTQSMTIYLQQIGRVLRYQPGKIAMILDLAGNIFNEGFGMPDLPREWSLDDDIHKIWADQNKSKQFAEYIVCTSCSSVHKAVQTTCPQCGYTRERKPAKSPTEVDMELVTIDDSTYSIAKSSNGKGYSRKAVIRVAASMRGDRDKLTKLAVHLGYRKGWVKHIESYLSKTQHNRRNKYV